jgi:hypothetical protein
MKRKPSPRLWPKATLDELRERRDLAVYDGDLKLAFQLATEIDKVRSPSLFGLKSTRKGARGNAEHR